MIRTTCTCFLDDGVTPCRKVDMCTRVEIRNGAGHVQLMRYACDDCRKRMKLPKFDCFFAPRYRGRPQPIVPPEAVK